MSGEGSPDVSVVMKIWALDWQGLAEASKRGGWRMAMWASLGALGIGLVGFVRAPHRRHTE